MTPTQRQTDARERILDAAHAVLSEKGLTNATTKEIARAAGYSEANLYKHFASKDRLMVAVFAERLPSLQALLDNLGTTPGTGDLRANLEAVARTALAFYRASVPIVGAMLADPKLLAGHRASAIPAGGGPWKPINRLVGYLEAEQEIGRLAPTSDPQAIAQLLLGACMQQAFVSTLRGDATPSPEDDTAMATSLTSALVL